MKYLIYALLIGIFFPSCTSIQNKKMSETTNRTHKEKVYVTALYYLKKDGQEKFEKYKLDVGEIFKKNNGSIEKMIKPLKLVKGNLALPNEIHFGVFENEEYFQATGKDSDYVKLVENYRAPALDSMIIIISRDAHSAVPQEVGDKSKFYAITLLTYKIGENHKNNFDDYLSKSCAIMPEFGAHFEKFLVPTMVKGNLEKPNKVHLFYFDSMEGVQKMATDPRMLELYPIRDTALSNATLILGKAL